MAITRKKLLALGLISLSIGNLLLVGGAPKYADSVQTGLGKAHVENPIVKSKSDSMNIAVVEVSTFSELKAAFASTVPMNIRLTNNIVMESILDGIDVRNPDLHIDGSDGQGGRYTLDFSNYYIHSYATLNCSITIENLNTRGGAIGWAYGAIAYDMGGKITARNVSHEGIEFLLASDNITLGGQVDVLVNENAATCNAISVWGTPSNTTSAALVIEDDAQVTIKQTSNNIYFGVVLLETASEFNIGKNADVVVEASPTASVYGNAAIFAEIDHKLKINLSEGATLSTYSDYPDLFGIAGYVSEINIADKAELLVSTVAKWALTSFNPLSIDVNGTFDITTAANEPGPIQSGFEGTIGLNDSMVSTWSSPNTTGEPDTSYTNVSGISTFLLTDTKTNSTTNADFDRNFNLGKVYRLLIQPQESQLVVNPYTLGDNSITGKANSEIVYVDLVINDKKLNVDLKVNDDGSFEIPGVATAINANDDVKVIGKDSQHKVVSESQVEIS
ncbi:immunoglobulin-like domain-containing protein [Lactococcus lactis]